MTAIERMGQKPSFPHTEAEAWQAILDQAGYIEFQIRPMRAAARILGLAHLARAVEALADMRQARRDGDADTDDVEWSESSAFTQVDAACADITTPMPERPQPWCPRCGDA